MGNLLSNKGPAVFGISKPKSADLLYADLRRDPMNTKPVFWNNGIGKKQYRSFPDNSNSYPPFPKALIGKLTVDEWNKLAEKLIKLRDDCSSKTLKRFKLLMQNPYLYYRSYIYYYFTGRCLICLNILCHSYSTIIGLILFYAYDATDSYFNAVRYYFRPLHM